ncbi:hypothetical protein N7492_008491 [Penicillium capsulatum]|uniref:Uncharacterized protein n=1 Tax=Penicillium capsulatum TaxID=69766 RepID=A0A9W9HS89_9EURO|nr:hypothetical protein N7492_008474 [Penicillium capsulatum]KAJ5155688.1 hypothetical protein N7492_008491 [Penicillium capsulatum]KAJ6105875.1 hypothetical protein N7512_009392 [Penicillium capsulatum]KAJ6105893.1 hypothetical protein N7512_009410 [Penicillium capsulatum]
MGLTSNERRAQRRQECREALAAHIRERTGLLVPPNRVRLQPSVEDGYAWSVSTSKEHLLKTSLSNGTVGVYQAILQELGRSIEAVKPQTLQATGTGQNEKLSDQSPDTVADSFTATIQRLEREKFELANDLERAQARNEELLEQDREWQTKMRTLQEQLRESQSLVEQLEKELNHAKGGIVAAITTLQDCQFLEYSAREGQ